MHEASILTESGMRLQSFLAERGVGSRRRCAEHIRNGRVCVNGQSVREPGFRIDPLQAYVTFDGRHIAAKLELKRTIILNKPRGYICSASAAQGRTVYDLLSGIAERVVPVGRLDKNSEGLLLLSSDGSLVDRVTHPRYGHKKTYLVTVSGPFTPRTLERLRSRLLIDGHRIQPAGVRVLGEGSLPGRVRLEFVLREGRNRQIRKMCALVSLRVHRILRVALGAITIGNMKPGEWRVLTEEEAAHLSR